MKSILTTTSLLKLDKSVDVLCHPWSELYLDFFCFSFLIKELEGLVHKMENEREKDLIIESRFHRQLIGPKGENIQKMREDFVNVQVFSRAILRLINCDVAIKICLA